MSRLFGLLHKDGGDHGRAQPFGEALNLPLYTVLRTNDQSATIEFARYAVIGKEIFVVAFLTLCHGGYCTMRISFLYCEIMPRCKHGFAIRAQRDTIALKLSCSTGRT